jgi:hypothetical protein
LCLWLHSCCHPVVCRAQRCLQGISSCFIYCAWCSYTRQCSDSGEASSQISSAVGNCSLHVCAGSLARTYALHTAIVTIISFLYHSLYSLQTSSIDSRGFVAKVTDAGLSGTGVRPVKRRSQRLLQQNLADQRQFVRKMSGSSQSHHSQGLIPFGSTVAVSSAATGTPAHRQQEQAGGDQDYQVSPFARQGSTAVFSAQGSTPVSSARPSCGGFGSAFLEAETIAVAGRASKASSAGQQQVQVPVQSQHTTLDPAFPEVRSPPELAACVNS